MVKDKVLRDYGFGNLKFAKTAEMGLVGQQRARRSKLGGEKPG
jgi:hypothetical protein